MKEWSKRFSSFLLILCILMLSFSYLMPVRADSGWDTGYDSGGYDSGGWDSGGYDSWDYDYEHSSDYGHSGGGGTNSYYTSSFGIDDLVFVIFFFAVIFFVIYALSYARGQAKTEFNFHEDISEDKLKEIMPNYTVAKLKEIVTKKFIDIQNAWMEFDYDKLRELCTDELYNSYKTQLETLKIKNGKNIMSDFITQYIYITDAVVENNNYVIKAVLKIEFYDYVINTINNNVIRGRKNTKVLNTYNLELVKSINDKDIKCPNCGAPVNAVTSKECEYCGSTIVFDSSDFVLSKKNIIK